MMTFDTQLFYFLNNLAWQSRSFDAAVIFFASYFSYVLIVVFVALVYFSKYSKYEKLRIFFIALSSTAIARFGITELIRFFYHRPRPFLTLHVHQLIPETSWSFPSGHATFFFALATVVYLHNKKLGVWFFIATIFITTSRIAAGVHYPSDILGGAIIGIAVALAVFYTVRKFLHTFRRTEENISSTINNQ
jgi:undecaprenyl-diphosphatase